MRISSIKKLLACACLSAFTLATSAHALMIGDAFYLGQIVDGAPSSASDEVTYINFLNDLAAGVGATAGTGGQSYERISSTSAGPFSDAVLGGATKDEKPNGSLILATPTEYIFGKYGGFALVWYNVAGFTGTVTVPTNKLSHLSSYQAPNPSTNNTAVPDGGATLALLGLSLGTLGFVSRKMRK